MPFTVLEQKIAAGSPIADFTWDAHPARTSESVTFNASKSYDPYGYDIISYSWNFGDGDTGTGKTIAHTYSNPGEYDVTLTVTNSGGKSDNITYELVVMTPATADFSYVVAEDTVTFTDRSSGNITGWYWDFGDGETSTNQSPTHTYTLGEQDYEVTMVVVNNNGLLSDLTKTVHAGTGPVNQPPVADFTYSCSGLTCNFTDLSIDPEDDDIIGWFWEFGDGLTSTLQNPTHQYISIGRYTVTLYVVDENGLANHVSKKVSLGS